MQKDGSITKAALYLLVILALATFVVNHTGEEAEEFVEHLPGYSHQAIHEHEEVAEWAFRLMILTGISAAIAIFMLMKRSAKARLMVLVTLLANLVACGFLAYAGKKGGEIRHTEIQAAAPPASE